jgi:endoglucanase
VKLGVQVHVGEWGVFNKTPHATALAWMEDSLSLWKEAGWGFSLWNLRGQFGVLDSGREDVTYEDFKGHKLDRRMLELLKRY